MSLLLLHSAGGLHFSLCCMPGFGYFCPIFHSEQVTLSTKFSFFIGSPTNPTHTHRFYLRAGACRGESLQHREHIKQLLKATLHIVFKSPDLGELSPDQSACAEPSLIYSPAVPLFPPLSQPTVLSWLAATHPLQINKSFSLTW